MHLFRQVLMCTNCVLLTLTFLFISVGSFFLYANKDKVDWLASPSAQNIVVYWALSFLFLVTVSALFGCCGVLKTNKKCLYWYMVFLAISVLFEGVSGFLLYRFYRTGELTELSEELMRDSMERYREDSSVQLLWDTYQAKMQCCGVHGPLDWARIVGPPPDSCCRKLRVDGEFCIEPYMDGCLETTVEAVQTQLLMLKICYLALFATHVVQLIVTCCLLTAIKRDMEYV